MLSEERIGWLATRGGRGCEVSAIPDGRREHRREDLTGEFTPLSFVALQRLDASALPRHICDGCQGLDLRSRELWLAEMMMQLPLPHDLYQLGIG